MSGRLSAPLTGVPEVYARGQGGLLDVALSPGFAQDKLVYFSFSEPGPGGAGTAVARGRLGERGLEGTQVIWRQQPKVDGPQSLGLAPGLPRRRHALRHGGRPLRPSRARAGSLDDARQGRAHQRRTARCRATIPSWAAPARCPEIWSLGHRNVQAAALDARGELWTVEHGARGGDELNNPQPGKNYGWPVITYGVDYSGARIGIGTAQAGMEQPVYYWDPVIAPSGATFYSGAAFADWKGDLLVGSLTPGGLVRLRITNGRVVAGGALPGGASRAHPRRARGPGRGHLSLDRRQPNGRLLRVTPAGR